MLELESNLSVVPDPSYDSFTLFLPEDERKRRRQRKMLVVGIIVGVVAASFFVLIMWESRQAGGAGQDQSGNTFIGQGGKLEEDMVSFMVVGDWGCSTNCPEFPTADTDQLSVSQTMTRFSKQDPHMAFVVSAGDNFYMKGVKSDADPLWKSVYSDRFGEIDLPWYCVLGNHDHFGNPRAQFSSCTEDGCPDVPPQWNMPFFNYSVVRPAGGDTTMQLVFIDTFILSEGYSRTLIKQKIEYGQLHPDDLSFFDAWEDTRRQLKVEQIHWIDQTLAASSADWLFVIGHYPVYSGGEHGDTRELLADIKPLLVKHKVDVYFSGHDHTLQHLQSEGVDYIVSGGGSLRGVVGLGAYPQTQFGIAQTGFALVQTHPDRVQITLIGGQGAVLYHYQRNRQRKLREADTEWWGTAVRAAAAQRVARKAKKSEENGRDQQILKGTKDGIQLKRLMSCVSTCEANQPDSKRDEECITTRSKSCWTPCEQKCLATWKDLKG